jgi:uncharacterized protein (TIGR01777 family)
MKIIVAGGTGFLGRTLVRALLDAGHRVVVLTRSPEEARNSLPAAAVIEHWDGETARGWGHHMNGADVIVNFAGASIGDGRWSAGRKEEILASRVGAGRAIVEAIRQATSKPAVLISASGVGYYGDVPEGDVVEGRPPGEDFLAAVCIRWEASAAAAGEFGVRVVMLRMAVVLGDGGGVLSRLSVPFRLFIGGPLGSGRQWFPWIHRDDVVAAVFHVLAHRDLFGPINVAAPETVTMEQFCSAVGTAMHRPSWARVPAVVLRILLGEMSITILGGQRVIPRKLLESGFAFKFPRLIGALRDIVA